MKRNGKRAGFGLCVGTAITLALVAGAVVQVKAQVEAQGEAQVLVVSKPPVPVVPSDPPQGLVFGLPPSMSASSPAFDTAGGPRSLEYLQFDAQGDAYITFDDGPDETFPGGIMVIDEFLERDGGSYDASRDRLISGAATGLLEPKDLAVADTLGVVVVADFAGAKVATFDMQAGGDAAPLFVVNDLGTTSAGEARRPWGVAFDAENDRLFVGGTDGTVLVFDDFLIDRGGSGPDRVVTPVLDGEQVSANTHDLVYVADRDLLIASDVGRATTADQPGFDSDGSVFVLENASLADGATEVRLQLTGPSTLLGNPTGIAFDGQNLFVTERTKDLVLRFDDVLSLAQRSNTAPSGAVTVALPEAVVLAPTR